MPNREATYEPWKTRRMHISPKGRGLQFRMTISYALITVAAVLTVEILIGSFFGLLLLNGVIGPTAQTWVNSSIKQKARIYALSAAAQADGTTLNPQSTFEPGQPSSIALSQEYFSSDTSTIAYIASTTSNTQRVELALLIDMKGQVLASSYPARYPTSMPVTQLPPNQSRIIIDAMQGRTGDATDITPQGRIAGAAETVWGHGRKPIGVLYIQAPVYITPEISSSSFFQGLVVIVIISGIFLLILTLPIGALFGMITTRGLVRSIRRLEVATANFADGDYTQRVPTTRADEVGQLEQHFNQMAEQLVESMEQNKKLTEQQARQEERARIEQEMLTAQHIQQSLLPKDLPDLPGWHFTPYYKPAKEVGGDFYDFLTLDDGRLGIVIGDVTGKGMPAALVMAITRTMLRTAAQATPTSPGAVLARVNELLCADIPPRMFVTCFYTLLDPRNGHLCYANAGHNLPYRWHNGTVAELRATGMPLGLIPGMQYEEEETVLAHDESILFYSDGLTEAHSPKRTMFGCPRLMTLLGNYNGESAPIDYLRDELANFTGEHWEQEDDITLVTLQHSPECITAKLLHRTLETEHTPAPSNLSRV